MDMVQLHSMEEFLSVPETAWKMEHPADGDKREDAMETGRTALPESISF